MRDRIRELELLMECAITALEQCGAKQKASYARRKFEAGCNRSLALQLSLDDSDLNHVIGEQCALRRIGCRR